MLTGTWTPSGTSVLWPRVRGGWRKKLTMLATVLEQYPDELRADFQQFYSLNLEGMGRTYTTFHAASLLTQLPEGSRVARALNPDAAWTMDRQLLAVIANDLNWLVWSQTKDGQKGPQAEADRPQRRAESQG